MDDFISKDLRGLSYMNIKKGMVFAFVLLVGLCTGCKNNDLGESDITYTVQEQKNRPILSGPLRTVSLDGSLDGSLDRIESPSWSKDLTPVVLDWFIAYDWFDKTFDPDNNWGDKKLLTHTGITLHVRCGSVEELNTIIASGSLPDLITYDVNSSIINKLEKDNMLYPLDELMEQYAPDMDVMPSMMEWYQADDGHWYRFVSFFIGTERINKAYGGHYRSFNGNWAREDILKQIGMTKEDMYTKEGFISVLEKVRDLDIHYNGNPVTPFMLDVWHDAVVERFAEQFGADLEDENGNWVNIMKTPEYLEALLFLNDMYNKGLYSDEEFTMDKVQKDAKLASGRVFALNGWVTNNIGSRRLWIADERAKMVYVGVIQGGKSGKKPIIRTTNSLGWSATVLTKDCEHPIRGIRLLSYLSQEELMLDNTYGTGTYQVINGEAIRDPEKVEEEMKDPKAFYDKYTLNLGLLLDTNVAYRYRKEPENWFEKEKLMALTQPDATVCIDKPFSALIPEVGTELSMIYERLRAYRNQRLPLIMMAVDEKECVALYEELIKEMDDMGMVALDTYRNQRFQENKKKMGMMYAWPRNQKIEECIPH